MSITGIMRRAVLAASLSAIVVSFAIVLPGSQSTEAAQGRGDGLFGGAWVARAIVKDGERVRLAKGTRLVLLLRHQGNRGYASWEAGCNRFGARLKVRPKRLRYGAMWQTAMGCPARLQRQDNRIARLLASDPRWKRKAGRLVLRHGDDAIRLRRR